MVRLFFLLLTAQLLALPLQASPPEDPTLKTPESFPRFPAVEPADVASTFVVQDGFQMQLIAAEPLITDPVAMTIDERGRALVVEMNDYPYTNAMTHVAWQDNTTDAPIGRIRLLEDSDGDGTYDRSTLFAEGLSWPSGIVCYRGGVFVTATPDIWYLKDNDGDGRADVREKIFTGFRKYNVQAVMNNPIWGLDNHLYVAGSSNGGSVLAAGQSQAKPIVARGDFRIDPRTNQLELQAGGARFGNAIDDWGNRFLCNIRNPAIHVVLDNRYLARNPYFAAPTAIYNIAESGDQMPIFRISPVEPWRDLRGRQWSADPTKKVPRSELTGGGVFTSTSGINVYRGSAYPPAYQGQIFVAEVANNVIYRQKVEADGNTFRATRADANAEFVASTDTWFRPVNLYNAPDGTLYVLDMYREFIEHPWSIPDDIHARLDLTSGRDRGRIYRLAPANFKPLAPPDLSKLTNSQLVAHLAHANSWYRETAQRLLVERGDPSIAKELRAILPSQDGRAAAHALWTLVGINALQRADVLACLENQFSTRLREQAVRVAEPWLTKDPAILQRVLALATDSDSRVRLQVAMSLGGLEDVAAVTALTQLALRDAQDPWMRAAVCSAPPAVTTRVLKALLAHSQLDQHPEAALLIEPLTQIAAAQSPEDMRAMIGLLPRRQAGQPEHENAIVDAFWNGLSQATRRKSQSLFEYFAKHPLEPDQAQDYFTQANAVAKLVDAEASTRTSAIARMTMAPPDVALPMLMQLVEPLQPQAVQIAAIRAVGSYQSTSAPEYLIKQLRWLTPAVQDEAFTVLLAKPDRTLELLAGIEKGRVPASLLGLARKTQLLSSPNSKIKQAAERVLGKVDGKRAAVIERYSSSLSATGDAVTGKALFTQHCAACHRAAGLGIEIGPHMETVRTWDRAKLLLNILDPNREVAPQSMSYSVALTNGSVISGMIVEETASSLTIKRPSLPIETILRQDIEQMTNTGISLMPIGFEETISPQAMADLMAFLQQ